MHATGEVRGAITYLTQVPTMPTPSSLLPYSLTPCRNLCALPSVTTEVPLKGSKLRVLLLQRSDVRLTAYVVDPPEIDGGLFAHLLLELVPGHLIVANLSPCDATKGLGNLGHGL